MIITLIVIAAIFVWAMFLYSLWHWLVLWTLCPLYQSVREWWGMATMKTASKQFNGVTMEFTESDVEIIKQAFEELIDPDGITFTNHNRTINFVVNCFKVSFFYDLSDYSDDESFRIIGALLTANDQQFLTVSGNSLTECCCNMNKELQEFVNRLTKVARFLRGNVILNEFDKRV